MRIGPGTFIPDPPSGGGGIGCGSVLLIAAILVIASFVIAIRNSCTPRRKYQTYTTQQHYQQQNSSSTTSDQNKKQDDRPTQEQPVADSKSPTAVMTGRESFFYHARTRGSSPEELLDDYTQRFDREYSRENKDNEFRMQERRAFNLEEIRSGLNTVSFERQFYCSVESELGEYDFTNGAFPFNPFRDLEQGTMLYVNWNDIVLYFANAQDFNTGGLTMPKSDAEEVVNQMPKSSFSSKIDRSVWVKIYYKALNAKYGALNSNVRYIGAFIDKIEIYLTRELTGQSIATLYSKSQPEEYMEKLIE